MAIRIVIADDHPIILEALDALFAREPDMEVVACCTNGADALAAVRAHTPDVLLLDIRMPITDGLAVMRDLHDTGSVTRVVVLTAGLDDDQVLEAMRLGVRGVVLKDLASEMLLRCVRRVHSGGRWLERHSSARILDRLLRREADLHELTAQLTPRELELTRLVAGGMRNREISEQLRINEGTVKAHLNSVYRKLGVASRVALAMYARDHGLV